MNLAEVVAENPTAALIELFDVAPEVFEKDRAEQVSPRLIDPEKQIEIVDGKVEIKEIAGAKHSGVATRLLRRIGNFAEEQGLGEVYGADATFMIGRNERLPDVSFVSLERIPPEGEPDTKWMFAPDLAIEVVSPNDSLRKVNKKIREYFAAGVAQVWLVEPEAETLTVYRTPTKTEIFAVEEELVCGEILPGFRLNLSDIFRNPRQRPN